MPATMAGMLFCRRLICGDTLTERLSLRAYAPGDGWAVHARLLPDGGGAAIALTAAADGDAHLFSASAATTLAWAPGAYTWAVWAEHAALGSQVLGTGPITLLPDPRTASAPMVDMRGETEIALANVRAMLYGRATQDVAEYSINGRSLKRWGIGELRKLETMLVAQLRRERRQAALCAGRPDPSSYQVRVRRA